MSLLDDPAIKNRLVCLEFDSVKHLACLQLDLMHCEDVDIGRVIAFVDKLCEAEAILMQAVKLANAKKYPMTTNMQVAKIRKEAILDDSPTDQQPPESKNE